MRKYGRIPGLRPGWMNGEYQLRCMFCDNPFLSKRPNAQYCGALCRSRQRTRDNASAAAFRILLSSVCVQCSQRFFIVGHTSMYCGPACAKAARLQAARQRRALARVPRLCRLCRTRFVPHHGLAAYCSPQCRLTMQSDKQSDRRIRHVRSCKECGGSFTASDSRVAYCSSTCRLNSRHSNNPPPGRSAT